MTKTEELKKVLSEAEKPDFFGEHEDVILEKQANEYTACDVRAELAGVSDSLFVLSQLFADEDKPIVSSSAVYGMLLAARRHIERIIEEV